MVSTFRLHSKDYCLKFFICGLVGNCKALNCISHSNVLIEYETTSVFLEALVRFVKSKFIKFEGRVLDSFYTRIVISANYCVNSAS